MRFITTSVHGVLDYLMGIFLIAMPWVFGFATGGAATWVPVIIGASVIAYSLVTNYEWGAVGVISMKTHLALDTLGGLLMAVSPWLFGFAGFVFVPHLVLGLAEMTAGLTTKLTPTRVPPSGRTPLPTA